MRQDRFLGMLGLAQRAGKVKSGSFLTEKAVDERKAKLLIFAGDGQSNTADRLREKAERAEIPVLYYKDKESLGKAVGKGDRSCLAVTDPGFANELSRLWSPGE